MVGHSRLGVTLMNIRVGQFQFDFCQAWVLVLVLVCCCCNWKGPELQSHSLLITLEYEKNWTCLTPCFKMIIQSCNSCECIITGHTCFVCLWFLKFGTTLTSCFKMIIQSFNSCEYIITCHTCFVELWFLRFGFEMDSHMSFHIGSSFRFIGTMATIMVCFCLFNYISIFQCLSRNVFLVKNLRQTLQSKFTECASSLCLSRDMENRKLNFFSHKSQ